VTRALGLLGTALLLLAAARSGRLRTGAEAVRRFERFFRGDLAPRLAAGERQPLAALLAHRPSAELRPCREVHHRVSDTLGPAAPSGSVLHGSPAALDRRGDCWALEYPGQLVPGMGAVLEPATGEVLLVWRIPEG
jgi:hypothetical protein